METKSLSYFAKEALSDNIADAYRRLGFVVVTDALAQSEIDQLLDEIIAILRGRRGTIHNYSPPDPATSDEDLLRAVLCIHDAHKISPVLHRFLEQPTIVNVLTRIISPNVKCMQSMFFVKAAGKPGQAWHQDEDFIPTRDRSLCGAWMALDDATTENGCLWVISGSHRHGILWPMYPHDDRRFDCTQMSYDFPYTEEDAIAVEVPRGAVVFFNGYLLHQSYPNRAKSGFRRSLVNHYMSAESLLPWRHTENVPIANQDFRDIVMVAGRDPYAYKGTTDELLPSVRPAGEGGCGDGRFTLQEFKTRGAKVTTFGYDAFSTSDRSKTL